MKKFFLASAILLISCASAYPYWIWTPKTGKWVNPKTAVKSTPQEQIILSKGMYDQKQYEEARKEFQKLLKHYPKSEEAAESQYYLGLIEEQSGNLFEAYTAYQKVIDKYPFSGRISEIIEKEYKIAEAFMAGAKRKAMGVALPVENPAIEIFRKIIDNSTYGPLAGAAQYKLGLTLKGAAMYYEAQDAFNKVISNYPNSEWVEAAKFQLAACQAAISRGADYDQEATRDAKDRFEKFIRQHPDAELSRQAQKNIEQLGEKEAESNYTIGFFYEKQKAYAAAKVYYDDIINRYPRSAWAAKALERLQVLDRKGR